MAKIYRQNYRKTKFNKMIIWLFIMTMLGSKLQIKLNKDQAFKNKQNCSSIILIDRKIITAIVKMYKIVKKKILLKLIIIMIMIIILILIIIKMIIVKKMKIMIMITT